MVLPLGMAPASIAYIIATSSAWYFEPVPSHSRNSQISSHRVGALALAKLSAFVEPVPRAGLPIKTPFPGTNKAAITIPPALFFFDITSSKADLAIASNSLLVIVLPVISRMPRQVFTPHSPPSAISSGSHPLP
ncbi:hypothetical protein C7974DRAFT_384587 [Boeremia exigua]|uniref:uncharacterized protein n=1 Tax=Boeremia exigua TaxID=749465 RepID=UPI001E8D5528|nr:uncharacterized protein C7974DRAFT_384587 [Boeremia exigua]KAH6641965.1 hypothetical protein C7974DRAFT_384587 [Boeremia exigua]